MRVGRERDVPIGQAFVEQQHIVHVFQVVFMLRVVMGKQGGKGFLFGFGSGFGNKQAELVRFGQGFGAITAHVHKIEFQAA